MTRHVRLCNVQAQQLTTRVSLKEILYIYKRFNATKQQQLGGNKNNIDNYKLSIFQLSQAATPLCVHLCSAVHSCVLCKQ
jgi:hypothetical protein